MDNMNLSSLFGAAPAAPESAPMGAGMGEAGAMQEKSPMDKVSEAMTGLDPKDVLQYMIDMGYVDKETKLIEPSTEESSEAEEGPDFAEME